MDTTSLCQRTILIVEDEPITALDIAGAFKRAGASVGIAHSLADARELINCEDVSAAIIKFGIGDGDGNEICERLRKKNVSVVLHSGYSHTGVTAAIPKPASPDELVDAVVAVLLRTLSPADRIVRGVSPPSFWQQACRRQRQGHSR